MKKSIGWLLDEVRLIHDKHTVLMLEKVKSIIIEVAKDNNGILTARLVNQVLDLYIKELQPKKKK